MAEFQGLLQQYGLPVLTKEEELKQRRLNRMREGTAVGLAAFGQGGPRKEQDFRRLGAIMGGAVGGALTPPDMTDMEGRKYEAVAAATERFKKKKQENPEAFKDPNAYQSEFETILAEELIKAGDVSTALPIITNNEQRRRLLEKQDAELDALLTGTRGKKQDIDMDMSKFKNGELVTVYPVDSNDPNSGVTARYTVEGGLTDGQGNPIDLEDVTIVRPKDPRTSRVGGGIRSVATPTELSRVRDQFVAAQTQVMLAKNIHDVLVEAAATGSSVGIVGKTGELTGGAARILDTVRGLGQAAVEFAGGGTIFEGTNLDGSRQSAEEFVRENEAFMSQFDLPETTRLTANQQMRYRAAIVQLAYAKARAVEPGAKQLSDADFKNALMQIGANASSPEGLRGVFLQDMRNASKSVRDRLLIYPPEYRSEVISQDAWDKYNNEYNDMIEVYSRDFGTNINPGEGLTDPEVDDPVGYFLDN